MDLRLWAEVGRYLATYLRTVARHWAQVLTGAVLVQAIPLVGTLMSSEGTWRPYGWAALAWLCLYALFVVPFVIWRRQSATIDALLTDQRSSQGAALVKIASRLRTLAEQARNAPGQTKRYNLLAAGLVIEARDKGAFDGPAELLMRSAVDAAREKRVYVLQYAWAANGDKFATPHTDVADWQKFWAAALAVAGVIEGSAPRASEPAYPSRTSESRASFHSSPV